MHRIAVRAASFVVNVVVADDTKRDQVRAGKTPRYAMHCISVCLPPKVVNGFAFGSAKFVLPSPPYVVPTMLNRTTYWLIGRSCPSIGTQPIGQKFPEKIMT